MRKPMIETKHAPSGQQLLTPAHVGELLQVEPRTVRKWLHQGALIGVRLPGGDWRVLHADFDHFLQQRRQIVEAAAGDAEEADASDP
jgi:excisionase family DNA binding protein